MVGAGLPDHVFDVERLPKTGIELVDAGLDLAPQGLKRVDPIQKLAAELLLRLG
jgi:hypothetical protein